MRLVVGTLLMLATDVETNDVEINDVQTNIVMRLHVSTVLLEFSSTSEKR
ncbi:hypothetical protein Q4575_17105 [Psychrosphaera sp. 1_MG-2023]|uniref:Uncharacterized protein n=1 Tax=Psychrosphaera algicola TaxID=3023714 RepID=A0ABT5FAW1_9GAMM|nr:MULTISPECIES: hypothetical protein [unclassified Psychrosphaera]MDC2888660.1 hypothetical protein [Psychrosphaera sp. G1-22]MDO6721132.1 hypothetical protein [Psychrosphaera sp. 1_MG-2023]